MRVTITERDNHLLFNPSFYQPSHQLDYQARVTSNGIIVLARPQQSQLAANSSSLDDGQLLSAITNQLLLGKNMRGSLYAA